MKKAYNQMIKAIEVTKKYSPEEVKKLWLLFSYLNNISIDWEDYKTWVSAKWLWKLLNPLTKSWEKQKFREWWESVSNISRLKEDEDFIKLETISKRSIEPKFAWRENSPQAKRGWNKGFIPVKEIDYILTLRSGEYCATLTKWDSGDLYRRFIFDIKDEFIRLVFRWGKSIETRKKFTKAISELSFVKKIEENKQWPIYWWATNLIYLELFWVKASEYKVNYDVPKREIAKHYFSKSWLLDLEAIENDIWAVIKFQNPKNKTELEKLIIKFFTT